MKSIRILLALALFGASVLVYQNCAEDFKLADEFGKKDSGSKSQVNPPAQSPPPAPGGPILPPPPPSGPCPIANGTGEYQTTGSTTNCVVLSCSTNYHKESNKCVEDAQACTDASGNPGLKIWDKVASQYGQCLATGCVNPDEHLENGICVSNFRDCTAELPGATKARRTWNGTDYGQCVLAPDGRCLSNYIQTGGVCSGPKVAIYRYFKPGVGHFWEATVPNPDGTIFSTFAKSKGYGAYNTALNKLEPGVSEGVSFYLFATQINLAQVPLFSCDIGRDQYEAVLFCRVGSPNNKILGFMSPQSGLDGASSAVLNCTNFRFTTVSQAECGMGAPPATILGYGLPFP